MKITTRTAPVDEKLAVRRQDRTRNEDQVAVDGELGKTVAAYKQAGGEKVPELKRPRVRFAVAPDDAQELKSMIRRAANLHKVAPVFFEDGSDEATGEKIVTLTVGPKPPKKEKATATA